MLIEKLLKSKCIFAYLLIIMTISGCEVFDAGYIPSDEYLDQLVIGETKLGDIPVVLGKYQNYHPPNSNWRYFIRQEGFRISAFPYFIKKRRIVALNFDDSNILSQIKKLTLKDKRNVKFNTKKTPESGVKKLNFLKEAISNIGKFTFKQ